MTHDEAEEQALDTELHVRRAKSGDARSVGWIVERFTPLLIAQARYRLGAALRAAIDPEDLVNEVWATVLPRLDDLRDAERATGPFLKFLSTTLLYKVNNLVRRDIRERDRRGGREERSSAPALANLEEHTRGVVTRVAHAELDGVLLEAIEALPERDREVIVLRAIEQVPNQVAAGILGESPNAVSLRFNRALETLRERLPGSILEDL